MSYKNNIADGWVSEDLKKSLLRTDTTNNFYSDSNFFLADVPLTLTF